jgi:hypothetical protein
MSRSRGLCYLSAMRNGIRQAHLCGPESVKRLPCYEANKQLFDAPRGAGYWAWKPALLNQIMGEDAFVQNVRENDLIVYADAGIEFINNVSHIIDRMGHDNPQDDIFLFGNNWEHHHWCKQSVIEVIWPVLGVADLETRMKLDCQRFGKQCQASVIFFRVSDYTRAFVAEWLKWCLFNNGELIDDSPSWIGNHPEFQEHRHDQAILTTMAYREGIPLHWWGARYNMDQQGGGRVYDKLPEYAADDYEPFVHHHRRRNHEWTTIA